MSLKRREILAYSLLFIAAVCWVFGIALANDADKTDVLTGLDVRETAVATTETYVTTMETYVATTVVTAPTEEISEYRQTSTVPEDNGFAGTNEDGEEIFFVEDRYGRIKRVAGVMLCAGTVCLAAVAIAVFRPTWPLLGPDGVCAGYGVLWVLEKSLADSDGWIWISWARFWFCIFEVFAVFTLLFFLRELFCWGMGRFSLRSCLLFRLAAFCRRPGLALLGMSGWTAAAFGACGVLVAEKILRGRLYALPLGAFGLMLVFGALCALVYGADIGHFRKQLENYSRGQPIEVGRGVFAGAEESLLRARENHEEAVKKAVVSERFKVELISNVSHDLRTPLTAILGYGELLEKEDLSCEGKERLARLNLKASYMNGLVEDLFELTKVSSGDLPPKMAEIDLARLLEQTVGFYDDKICEPGLTVRRKYPAEALPVVTDGARMHRVFANLLGNAIKYAMKGTRIFINVTDMGEAYRVRMINTASYEMDFDSEEIVKRFARGDKARTTQGSGLGLAIAKTYTESVGGKFRISVDGDQFCAIVELPKSERDS